MIIDDKDMISDGANSLHLISDAIYEYIFSCVKLQILSKFIEKKII